MFQNPAKHGATKAKGAIRDKTGCYTCKIRRKKCDGQLDASGRCSTCVHLRLECLNFGEKRPEWFWNPDMVKELREKIKRFLAAQGMIKSRFAPSPLDVLELSTPQMSTPHKSSFSPLHTSSYPEDWNMAWESTQPSAPAVESGFTLLEQPAGIEEYVSTLPYSLQEQFLSRNARTIQHSRTQTSYRRPSEHFAFQVGIDDESNRDDLNEHDTPSPLASEERSSKSSSLIATLGSIFGDVALYKQLLSCRDAQAQKVLDVLQELLDAAGLDFDSKRSLIVAAQRLSKTSGLFPTCYSLEDVQHSGDPVAAGSFADIYRGRFRNRSVCVKVIRVYQTSRIVYFLKKCTKEALLWGQLTHPNICPIYGLYRHDTRICLISPWMENGNLHDYLERHPLADRLLLVCDAAQGLLYLHDNEIIHGDLKGANILVSASGRACLADFGLSSVSDANILAWTSNSSAESKGGSVRWQAPELFNFETDEIVPNSKASDIYALSSVCYEAFTGAIPFAHLTYDPSVIVQVKAGNRPTRPPDSSLAWSTWGLTERIWSTMTDCWNVDPSLRPTVHWVVESLTIGVDQVQMSVDDNTLSAAQFRKQIGARQEIMSAEAFEALVGISCLHTRTTGLERSSRPDLGWVVL